MSKLTDIEKAIAECEREIRESDREVREMFDNIYVRKLAWREFLVCLAFVAFTLWLVS